jgi:hypothetical protein
MQKSVISLREVARRLGEFRKPKRIIDPDKLLSLLKSGALSAGFEFPGRKIVLWIPIPQNYWLTVHMHKFQSLGFQLDDPSSGTFTVRISEFSEELTKSVTQTDSHGGYHASHVGNLASLKLALGNQKRDVTHTGATGSLCVNMSA